jgi:NADH-quinone oxidoreductase subunit C
MNPPELIQKLCAQFPGVVESPVEFRGEWSVTLNDAERIAEVCDYARRELQFDFLVDITSIDEYGDDPRWTLVYHLYGLAHKNYLRVRTRVSEEKSEAPTVIKVWATADWHEREIFDMMGIRFRGHPDLRRILMWEGYPHHPLRKDFPLAGKPTEVPEVAFSRPAPLMGGPFVTVAGGKDSMAREPRVRLPENEETTSLPGQRSGPVHP